MVGAMDFRVAKQFNLGWIANKTGGFNRKSSEKGLFDGP
jgi:hypothetical protein